MDSQLPPAPSVRQGQTAERLGLGGSTLQSCPASAPRHRFVPICIRYPHSHVAHPLQRHQAFASRMLALVKWNYAQSNKEALAIILAVSKFHTYPYGCRLVLVADPKPLTTAFSLEKDLPVMTAARLKRYDFSSPDSRSASSTAARTTTQMRIDSHTCRFRLTQRAIPSMLKWTPTAFSKSSATAHCSDTYPHGNQTRFHLFIRSLRLPDLYRRINC